MVVFIVYTVDNLSEDVLVNIEGVFENEDDAKNCIGCCMRDVYLGIDRGDFGSRLNDAEETNYMIYNDKYYIEWNLEEHEVF